MAEVSWRVGARAVRVSVLSSCKCHHSTVESGVQTAPVSSTPARAECDHRTRLSAPEKHEQPASRVKLPSSGLSRETCVYRGRLSGVIDSSHDNPTAASSSAQTQTLQWGVSGDCVLFLGDRNQNMKECSSHQRRAAPQASSAQTQTATLDPGGRVRRATPNATAHTLRRATPSVTPVRAHTLLQQQVRGLRSLVQQSGQQHGLFSPALYLAPPYLAVCTWWACARPFTWRREDKETQPLYRSRTAYYDILCVSPSATAAQIKSAYYRQSFRWHPDRSGGGEECRRRFAEVSEAYGVLGNVTLRRKYDSGILTATDLQASGRPSSREHATHTPPGPRQHAHTHAHTHAGGRSQFDYEAFYRGHYGNEAARREAARRREAGRRAAQDEYQRFVRRKSIEVSIMVLTAAAGLILLSLTEQ